MKILVISNLYPPCVIGGYELNCRNVVEALQTRGCQVTVATTPNYGPAEREPSHVRRGLKLSAFMPMYGPEAVQREQEHFANISTLENVQVLHGLLQELVPDIVFLWNLAGLGGLHLIDFLNTHGVPWAIYLGDRFFTDVAETAPRHVRAIFRGHDPGWFAGGAVMAVSQHLVEQVAEQAGFGFPRPPVIVHGYAAANSGVLRRGYQLGGCTRFITAGRVGEHKGTGLICEAATLLAAAGIDDFEVDIYGGGNAAPFISQVSAAGIAGQVNFHGVIPQQDLLVHYRSADVFLFPTWEREPFAFAPFEAAAEGCVPILTATCGSAERIVDQVHGFKIKRTAQAVATAMRQVITGEIALGRIGTAAAAMVRSDLTLARHVDKIVSVLRDECRPWNPASLSRSDVLSLPFLKHFLSLKLTMAVR